MMLLLLMLSEQHGGKPCQLRHLPLPYFTRRKITLGIQELAVSLTGVVMDTDAERYSGTIRGRRGELPCGSRTPREWQVDTILEEKHPAGARCDEWKMCGEELS